MTQQLTYGIETTPMNHRLFLDVPPSLVARVQQEHPAVDAELESLSAPKAGIIDSVLSDGAVRLALNSEKIGARRDDQSRRQAARRIVALISTIDGVAYEEEQDPNLNVQMGTEHTIDGRLHMRAEVTWPRHASDKKMRKVARYFMRTTADALNYERKLIDELVYADVRRERGVTLETNPFGSCNIGAGGDGYHPERPTVELYQHNLYSPIQQLICLAGAVAMANTDKLLVPADA